MRYTLKTEGSVPTFSAVDHVALSVTDLVASHDFYTGVLGFLQVADFGPTRIYLHNPSAIMLALKQHPDAHGGRFTELATGLDHVALTVGSLAELREWEQRLRDAGAEFTPIREAEFGHHLNFRDPDGIALELATSNEPMAAALALLRSGELSDDQVVAHARQLLEQVLPMPEQ